MSDKPLVLVMELFFFACVRAGRDLVSGVQLARRPVLDESEDHSSAIREKTQT